ncbi:hypothetical protein J2R96_003483 [Bradyrhizobium elkanii]|nr:hypothetical protein [Bradyrhizobium elkanii]
MIVRRRQRPGIEAIAAARHRLDDAVVIIAQLQAQLADALDERVVGNRDVTPDRLVQILLGCQPPGIAGEIAEHRE